MHLCYFFARSRIWESLGLLLVAFTLFRPGFWLDYVQPPFDARPGTEIAALAEKEPDGATLRIVLRGPDYKDTDKIDYLTILLPLGDKADGVSRLEKIGVVVNEDNGKALLDEPFPGKWLDLKTNGQFDYYADTPVEIEKVEIEAKTVLSSSICMINSYSKPSQNQAQRQVLSVFTVEVEFWVSGPCLFDEMKCGTNHGRQTYA